MKKLFMFVVLMGLVSALNAQTLTRDRDIFTEQVINAVSSLKLNMEKHIISTLADEHFLKAEAKSHNPLQYIQQPSDYISIASTAYDAVWLEAEEMLENLDLTLENHPSATTGQKGEEDVECSKINNVKS